MKLGSYPVRELFTAAEASARGLTPDMLRWGATKGRWTRIARGVYGAGCEPPTSVDVAAAEVLRAGGVANGTLAGLLYGLDAVELTNEKRVRRRALPEERLTVVDGIRCTDGLQTIIDLAATLDDLKWEQALESALRKRLVTIGDIETALPELARARTPGTSRIRRVLALRPPGARPTESLLETLMVQLMRTIPGLPPFERQYEVYDHNGIFVARVDFTNVDLGLFIEMDGEHHKGQPVYDASRETAVVAATAWLCGRFTWTQVTRVPKTTGRRLVALVEQARRRRFSP